MNIWCAIPTKPFESGKTRLAGLLTPSERQALNREFFERTLRIVVEVFESNHVIIVSKSQEALKSAHMRGTHTLKEIDNEGLNEALTRAAEFARSLGADGILSVSCDLPILETEDLHAVLNAPKSAHSIAIAGDRWKKGTNALLVAPARAIPYRYGVDSFAAHCAEAVRAAAKLAVVERPGLAFDVDTPDDLRELRPANCGTVP